MQAELRRTRAVDRANEYAPMPAEGGLMSGAVGVGVAGIAIATFCGFYSIGVGEYWPVSAALLGGAFVVPFGLSIRQQLRHRRAVHAELRRTRSNSR